MSDMQNKCLKHEKMLLFRSLFEYITIYEIITTPTPITFGTVTTKFHTFK